jgi:hypothetical protein
MSKITRYYILLLFLSFSVVFSQNSLKILKPGIEGKTSFAIFIDKQTYEKTEKYVNEYKESIEKTKLPCFLLIAEWSKPEEIKEQILKLYNQKPKLEGVVFIGDIPIVMLRDAQHFSSAFKMDQNRYQFIKSSIPSDRYYDDFDLEFKFLKRDSLNNMINYYSLLSSSPSVIEKEIYSARIKPTEKGNAKYQQIEKYLKKVIRIKNEKNILNKFMFGTGDGYVSDSHDAFISEVKKFQEYFPYTSEYDGKFIQIFCKNNPDMKKDFLNYLGSEDLDLTILTAHGEPYYEYINYVKPKDTTKAEKDKSFKLGHILIEDIKSHRINTRMMICNSCFNGAFIEQEYLGGEYIFSEGNCVVSCANSVNVLQDIWVLEDGGILEYGARAGEWHKNIVYLESHLFGDPTFAFTTRENNDDLQFVLHASSKEDIAKLKELAEKSPRSVIRSVALSKLFKIDGSNSIDFLVSKYKNDPSAEVRTKIIRILARTKRRQFEDILLLGINDPSEFIRRVSVKILGEFSKEIYIPEITKFFIIDNSERVKSSADGALSRINPGKSMDYVLDLIKKNPKLEEDSILMIKTRIGFNSKIRMAMETDSILKTTNLKKKSGEIRTLRGNRTNFAPETLIKIISGKDENISLRATAAEALGWYSYLAEWKIYVDKLDEILKETNLNNELKENLITAKKRLISGPNHPLTP